MRPTERRHPDTVGIDALGSAELVDLLIEVHEDIPRVVRDASDATASAVELAVEQLHRGGRLVYIACGTSGWLADADAAELTPTFGFAAERLVVVRARQARATPGDPDEDHPARGAERLDGYAVGRADVAVAIASSGSTPFTVGAARAARERGAKLVAVVNVPGAPLAETADVAVVLDTGAEPILGSTRMRAGGAQRLWLTIFSTAVMVRLGLTHDNLMVNVSSDLTKLRERRVTLVVEATGLGREEAQRLIERANGDLRVAIVMELGGVDAEAARDALHASDGSTRRALSALSG
jgi:N-acetylmuramic acid 6-phosphate etherase